MLNKEQILAVHDLVTESVEVPEWLGCVLVRALNGTDRDAFEQSIIDGKKTNLKNIRARLCALCMVDDDGKRLFSDADVNALGQKSASALDRVFRVAQKLNGLSPDDVKELEKNSGSGLNADSTSD